jgi:Zn-dependent protease with chaperone function
VAIEVALGYPQISAKAYEHPADKAATSALHAVPLLDTVVKRLTDLGHERRLRQIVMGNAIRLGPEQIPDVWGTYVRCTTVLDLPEVPDLYVINNADINAMTIGAKTPIVIVNSSMLRSFDAKETETVLGHEASHVLSEHYYYTTALVLMSQFLQGALPRSLLLGLPVRAMYLALLEWARAAELSADRAAALVMADPLQPCRVLMQLAGGSVPGMNFEAFLKQASEYENEDDLFSRHARFWSELNLTHPVAVRRVKELMEWVQSGAYDRIRDGDYPRRGQEPPPSEEFEEAVAHYRERFSRILDRAAGGVQELGKRLGSWLERWQTSPSGHEGGATDDGDATDEGE